MAMYWWTNVPSGTRNVNSGCSCFLGDWKQQAVAMKRECPGGGGPSVSQMARTSSHLQMGNCTKGT